MIIGALEAGGTKMVCAIGNEKGEILKRISIPTKTPETTMPEMIAFFKKEKVERLIKLRKIMVASLPHPKLHGRILI